MAIHFSLHIRDTHFTVEEIRTGGFKGAASDPFASPILQFCHNWLKGQKEFVVQTSGSTGLPKSITISRRQMRASACQTVEALGLQTGQTALLCINAAYIGGKMMLIRAMEHGLQLTATPASSDPLNSFPAGSSFDFVALVPLQLESILQNPHSRAILNNAQSVIVGGAPVSSALKEQLKNMDATFYSTYGMTETVSHIALQQLNGREADEFFRAFPEIKLAQDERNCLIIEGEVTANIRVVTNDVVELREGNRFRWLGRADNIINSGGIKVQLEKVDRLAEAAFLQLSIKKNVFAWGMADEHLGQRLVLIVESAPFTSTIERKIHSVLKDSLTRFERPKEIFYMRNFCYTPSGKIQKGETASLLRDKP